MGAAPPSSPPPSYRWGWALQASAGTQAVEGALPCGGSELRVGLLVSPRLKKCLLGENQDCSLNKSLTSFSFLFCMFQKFENKDQYLIALYTPQHIRQPPCTPLHTPFPSYSYMPLSLCIPTSSSSYIALHTPTSINLSLHTPAPTYTYPYPTHIPTCLYTHKNYILLHTHPQPYTHTSISPHNVSRLASTHSTLPGIVKAVEGTYKLAGKIARTHLEK